VSDSSRGSRGVAMHHHLFSFGENALRNIENHYLGI
jgi:hypothetical protein